MKRFLLFWIIVITSLVASAQGQTNQSENTGLVSVQSAREIGMKFLNTNSKTRVRSANGLLLDTTYLTTQGAPAFYVFNTQNGFVMVAANDCSTPILGYSDEGRPFNTENIPIQMQEYLQGFVEQIQYGMEHNVSADQRVEQQWQQVKTTGKLKENLSTDPFSDRMSKVKVTRMTSSQNGETKALQTRPEVVSFSDLEATESAQIVLPTLPGSRNRSGETGVGPLITANWDQGCYYNAQCPSDTDGICGHVPTGCVATAMGMIMRYWGYPAQGTGTHSYTPNGYPEQTVNFGTTTYDWDNMPDQLDANSTQAQIDAVSTLLWHCGVAVDMMYSSWSSSALDGSIPDAFHNYFNYSGFGYCSGEYYKYKEDNAVWLTEVKTCLDLGRPLLYFATDSEGLGGHAFVCDGYNSADQLHFNWGWGGNGNGYFAVDALNVEEFQFNNDVHALFGIMPPSEFQLKYNIIEGGVEVTYEQPELGYSSYFTYPDTIVIPSQVTIDSITYPVIAIGEKALQCCFSLRKVVIPNSVKTIGEYAFYSSGQLPDLEVVMSDSVINIGEAAFFGSGINSIDLPNTLTTIGPQALAFCENLNSLTIPRSLTSCGHSLTSPRFFSNLDTLYWNADSCVLVHEGYNWNIAALVLNFGEHVRYLPDYIFSWGRYSTLTLPDSLVSIGDYSFSDCNALTSITIPENVEHIGNDAFYECENLTSVNFNAKHCTYAPYIFERCDSLNTVNFGDSVRIIPGGILEDLVFTPSVSTVNIGTSVDTIEYNAFRNCSNITTITLPSSIKYIYWGAFSGCSGLSVVDMSSATTPPTLGYDPFENNAKGRKFLIPCESYDAYYNAEGWHHYEYNPYEDKYFIYDYRPALKTVPETDIQLIAISNDTSMGSVDIYRNASVCDSMTVFFAQANFGYHFDHWSTGSVVNPDTLLLTNDTTIVAYFAKDQFNITGIAGKPILFSNFENPQNDSVWGLKNDNYVNKWQINELDDSRFMYVSNDDGQTNSYTNTDYSSNSYVIAYTTVLLDSSDYLLSYDWRADGYGFETQPGLTYLAGDCLIPFMTSLTIDSIPTLFYGDYTFDSIYFLGYDFYNYPHTFLTSLYGSHSWKNRLDNVHVPDNGEYTLGFYWRNTKDNVYGYYHDANGYPAAIDNVVLGTLDSIRGYVIGAENVDYLDSATITAVPNPGYRFVCWNDGDTNITKHVVVTGDLSFVAYFENEQYIVVVNSSDTLLGTVAGGGVFGYSEECTITATPADGYHFFHWNDGNTDNPRTITVTQDTTLTAIFGTCSDTFVSETVTACDSYVWNDSIYTESGDYTQSFTKIDGCDSIVTLHLTIYPTPTVTISGNQHVCETEPVILVAHVEATGLETGDLHFTWYESGQIRDNMAYGYGDDSVYVEYMYPRNEPYHYSVEVTFGTDFTCVSQSGEYLVYVHSQPIVNLTATETSICVGGTTTISAVLNDYNDSNVSYSWSNGYSGPSYTFSPASSGFYTFTVTVTNLFSGCAAIDEITIEVNDIPETPVVTTDNPMIFDGGQVTLSVTNPVADAIYTWYRNGELIEGSVQATLVEYPLSVGGEITSYSYNVFAALYNSGCVSAVSANTDVTVAPTPVAVVSVVGNTMLCEGGSTTLHVEVTPAAIPYTYQWYVDNEPASGATSADFVFAEAARITPYNIYVMVSANGGYSGIAYAPDITVVPQPVVVATISNEIVCEGETLTLNANVSGTIAGDVLTYQWYQVVNGNTVAISDAESPIYATSDLLIGSSYNFYVVVTSSIPGCSVASDTLETTVQVMAKSHTDFYETACDSFTWIDGVTYTESTNTPTFTLTNAAGCDSIVTLILTINSTYHEYLHVSACEEYVWNGETYLVSGDYDQTFTAANGCDSVVTLHLTVNYGTHNAETEVACDSYEWNGETYTTSGTYTYEYTNADGCPSVDTLHLTINYSTTGIDEQTACESFTWIDGVTYTESTNTPTFTLTNAAGCDSIVTLILTINSTYHEYLHVSACEEYVWNGETYLVSGDYDQTFTAANGCDSVVTLHLTVNYGTHNAETEVVCDSYEWYGETYATTGVYTYEYTNADGCPSVDTLHLTINYSTTGIDEQTACESFTWIDGVTYTESTNTPTFTLTNAAGCDSVVTLHLIIYESTTSEFTITTPEPCYTWYGIDYCESGDYTQTLQTVHGCDSIVTLHLTITVGIDDHETVDFKVFPNPTTGVVNVECTVNNVQLEGAEIQVVDMYGKLVDVVGANNYSPLRTIQIDLSRYAAGVYFLKAVADGETIAVRKVVKQ